MTKCANRRRLLSSLIIGIPVSDYSLLVLMLLFTIVLGMFIDVIPIVLITAPVYFPIVNLLGFDALWFGIVYNTCMIVGLISPPFGVNLFYMKGVLPNDSDVTMGDIYRGALPFVPMHLLAICTCFAFPMMTLFLPNMMS